jgi:signal transduction histidine kinase
VRELATRFATPARAIHVDAGELDELPAAVDLAAYRIVAESLANAAKHADATELRLVLSRNGPVLEVRVSDDGVGVRPGAPAGVGLRSMRDRAEELGGSCAVQPGDGGRGTTVVAQIPVQREA